MEKEIPQELRDKLAIIEVEIEFFSQPPKKPGTSRFIALVMIVLMMFAAWYTFTGGEVWLFIFIFAVAGGFITNYAHEKRLHEMYSAACEIIAFYKGAAK